MFSRKPFHIEEAVDENALKPIALVLVLLSFKILCLGHMELKLFYLYIPLFIFVFCPKSLKLPRGLTKLCNFVNKVYDD